MGCCESKAPPPQVVARPGRPPGTQKVAADDGKASKAAGLNDSNNSNNSSNNNSHRGIHGISNNDTNDNSGFHNGGKSFTKSSYDKAPISTRRKGSDGDNSTSAQVKSNKDATNGTPSDNKNLNQALLTPASQPSSVPASIPTSEPTSWGHHKERRRGSEANERVLGQIMAKQPRPGTRRKSIAALEEALTESERKEAEARRRASAALYMQQVDNSSDDMDDSIVSEDCSATYRRRRFVDQRYSTSGSLLPPELSAAYENCEWAEDWVAASTLHAQGYSEAAEEKWRNINERILQTNDAPEECVVYAKVHLAAVLHDLARHDEATWLLRECLRPEEPKNSNRLGDVLVHHNLALVLRDSEYRRKTEIEDHARRAMEGLTQLYGLNHVVSLTALSELSLIVFEQARIIESYLLARRAKRGFMEVFGDDHSEVTLATSRLSEVFEVEEWYRDDAVNETSEVLLEKGPDEPMGGQWNGSRLEAVGPMTAADRAGLADMVGRELRTVNGITIKSLPHLKDVLASTTIAVMWFEDKTPTMEDIINQTLPSLGCIPSAQSFNYGRRRHSKDSDCQARSIGERASSNGPSPRVHP
ncbi:hypothetical protein DIPPA_26690 [Diplonema papillatum]|nr:hypothetical protein DIPPA_26690 [Diplonema papillatum]